MFHNGTPELVWSFKNLISWTINKKLQSVTLKLQNSIETQVNFRCVGFPARIIQEFLGGYIFLQLKNQRQEDATDIALKKLLFHG